MGRFWPNVRTVPPLSSKAKRMWMKSEIAVLHKKLNYNLKVLRKNRRMEKTAITRFILCTRTIDTMSSECMSNTWDRGNIHTGLWWGDLTARDRLERLGVEGKITLKLLLNKQAASMCTGFIGLWVRGSGSGLVMQVSCDVTLCHRVRAYRRFEGIAAPSNLQDARNFQKPTPPKLPD